MKANNLHGEYCQNCAAILDDVHRNHRRVIVLDSQCAAVYHQSGDAERLEGNLHNPPALPTYEESKKSEAIKETVHTGTKTAKATHKPIKSSRR